MSVRDRWHLARPEPGAKKCGKHKLVPSSEHEQGLRWQVTGTDDHSKTVKRNFDSVQEAKDHDAELRASVKAGKYVDERAARVTLRSRCELWLTTRKYDPITRERVEASFANHVYSDDERPAVTPRGGVAIGDVSMLLLSRRPSTLAAWLAGLPLHVNTRCLMYDLVSSVFESAVHDHLIAENPFGTSVRRPAHLKSDAVAWDVETVGAVAGKLPAHLEALPLLAAACGQRQAEAFAVSKPDLNIMRRTCRVEMQLKLIAGQSVFAPIKNDKPRVVPLARDVADLLAEHMQMFPPTPVTLPWLKTDGTLGKPVTRLLVFTRPDGRVLTRNSFNPMWRRAVEAAGVEAAKQINGFHVCRHSAAAVWLSGGLNIAKVARFLGDSVQVVSTTYSHFLPGDDDRARGIMDEHFSGLPQRRSTLIPPLSRSDEA